jgi:beta-lactamase superfamily II metal-dependent hydrolase
MPEFLIYYKKVISVINSVLFHDNIEHVIDYKLVNNCEIYFKNMIFVLYHHKISISLRGELIELVKLANIIFPVRYKNSFNFPHKKVMLRYIKNNQYY